MATTPKNMYRGTVALGGVLGTTWWLRSALTSPVALIYANGTYVTATSNSSGNPSYSLDQGVTWTGGQGLSLAHLGLAYGNGVFVRPPSTGINSATSSDGITFTAQTLPVNTSWSSVAFGANTFLLTSSVATTALTSPDGVTWTSRVMPAIATWRLAFGSGLFVALAQSSSATATSPDGINWTTRSLPGSANYISYNNNLFLAWSSASSVLYTSPDGITWTTRTLPAATGWGFTAAYGSGLYLIPNSTNPSFVATSPDTITWTKRPMPVANLSGLNLVAAGNNSFVVSTSGGVAYSSHSGSTTLYTAGPSTTGVMTDIILVNPQTVAVSANLQIDGLDLLPQATSIAAGDRLQVSTRQVIESGKSVTAYTDGKALNVFVNGVEII